MKDVVVIGAGLTGLSTAHHLVRAGLETLVLEQKNSIGGVISTSKCKGFLYEQGPNTGVVGNIEVLRLFKDLEGLCQIETANSIGKNRYVLKNGQWKALPSGLSSAVSTPLFTLKDKFRILGEPWRKKGKNPHETLAELVKRRMGNSFLDYAIDPFILGVYAGDPARLVPKYALPKLYNLEQNYGSFIKGSIQKKKIPLSEEEKQVTREIFSIKGGLSNLIQALEQKVGKNNIILNTKNITVNPKEDYYEVRYVLNGVEKSIETKQVISTIGAYNLDSVLPFIKKEQMKTLQNLYYTATTEVVLGFDKWNGFPLDGFGGLIPFKENRDILGLMFMSSLFKNRAPKGGALFSIFVGGVRRPELCQLNDEETKKLIHREVQELMQLKEYKPSFIKIIRYNYAIPQYEANSGKRFECIKKVEKQYKGLQIGGNTRNGIGMADRILQAKQLAEVAINQTQMNS